MISLQHERCNLNLVHIQMEKSVNVISENPFPYLKNTITILQINENKVKYIFKKMKHIVKIIQRQKTYIMQCEEHIIQYHVGLAECA